MVKLAEEDLTEQITRRTEARTALSDALADLATESKKMGRQSGNDRPVDLSRLHALMVIVKQKEEACDVAQYDVATASGEDG